MKITTILLVVIFIFSLLVRIIGTNPGHWEYHPDEPTTYDTAANMIINHDINPRRFDYPAGLPLMHMVAFTSFFVPARLMTLLFEKPDVLITGLLQLTSFPGNISDELFGVRGIDALFWSRYITAVLGAFCIIALYMLSNVLFGEQDTSKRSSKKQRIRSSFNVALEGNSFSRTVGLIASFFLAFNYLSVLRSHLALPDIPNALFTIIALIFIAQLFKKDSPRNYYMAAIAIGIVFAIKFQVFVILPFAFVHILWSIRRKSLLNLIRKEVFFSGIIVVITFFAINPYLPFHIQPVPVNRRIESFITSNEVTAKRYAFGSNVLNPFPFFFLYKWGIGNGVTLSILTGAVLMLALSPIRFIFLTSVIVPFMYSFVYYGGAGAGYYVRNYASILPLLLIFAGFLFATLLQQLLKRSTFSKNVTVSLLIIVLCIISWDQIVRSSTLAYYWSKPWLHVVSAQWAGKHLPKDAQIEESSGLVQGHMKQYGDFKNILTWGRDSSYSVTSLAEMEEEGSDFILLVSNQVHHQTISWMNPLTFSELLAYDDVPYEKLDNTYLGLSIYQMFDYAVYSAYHLIEYPNQFFIISKIPKTNTKPLRNLKTFEFNTSQSTWDSIRLQTNDIAKLTWIDKEGGMVRLQSSNSLTRFSSPFLPVEEGKVYQVIGRVKNSHEVPKIERSVFLRVDLYANEMDSVNASRGGHVAVSPRLWGDTNWQELKVTTVKIPKGIHSMQIGIQAHGDKQIDTYLDSVKVFEIENGEQYPDVPIKPVRIPSTYIYPKAIY